MYKTRSDALLQIPYGDSILFGGELEFNIPMEIFDYLDDIKFEKTDKNKTILAQIRDSNGKLLAELTNIEIYYEPIYDEYAANNRKLIFFLHTDVLLPVGLHYMDIRIELNSIIPNKASYPVISHSEIVKIEVIKSVSHPFHENVYGQDRNRLEQYE